MIICDWREETWIKDRLADRDVIRQTTPQSHNTLTNKLINRQTDRQTRIEMGSQSLTQSAMI